MAGSVVRLLTLVAGFVLSVALVPTGGARVDTRSAELPSVYFMYAMNCTFTVDNDAGNTVSSIAPGTYNVVVRTPVPFGAYADNGSGNMTACGGLAQFQLTGPGVNLSTTVYGGCLTDQEFVETFQPSSSYIAQDNNQPSVTRTVLTTLASGTPTAPPQGPTSPNKGTASTDIVGSAILPLRGTLMGLVSASGKLLLTSKGRRVSSLKVGRYRFMIRDRDPRSGFAIRDPDARSTINLTGVKFVGERSQTITLRAGRWTYFTSPDKRLSFLVTS